MNHTFLIGRITKDLELRTTPNQKSVCEFTLAVDRVGDGVDFINCTVWNNQAENLVKYQGKGSQIAVSGSVRVDKYEVEGQNRYKTYVLVNQVQFLSTKSSEEVSNQESFDDFDGNTKTLIDDDDLPF